MEQAQEWFGISINPFYTKKFEWVLPEIESKNILIPYSIPTKFGQIGSYAINPFTRRHALGETELIEGPAFLSKTYEQLLAELMVSAKDFSVLHKFTNTKKFLEYITNNSLFRN